jgi:hypothetical protein
MTPCGLTPRERMHRMLERRDHDRVPRSDGYWPETITRWQGEGLAGDEETVYGLLGRDVDGICWSWPVPPKNFIRLGKRHFRSRMGTRIPVKRVLTEAELTCDSPGAGAHFSLEVRCRRLLPGREGEEAFQRYAATYRP